jgi:hypothetical protein
VANLFTPPETPAPARKPHEKPASSPKIQPAAERPRNTPDKPAPARPREIVTLTYRGMYIRGDGIRMALIADSKSGRTSFYAAGTRLFGLTLQNVEAETLGVSLADNTPATLKRGIPQAFPEEQHAD